MGGKAGRSFSCDKGMRCMSWISPGAAARLTSLGATGRLAAWMSKPPLGVLSRRCVVFQIHYTPNGKATSDRTRIGFIFSNTPPDKKYVIAAAAGASERSIMQADRASQRADGALHSGR